MSGPGFCPGKVFFRDKSNFLGEATFATEKSLYIRGAALLVVETQSKRDKKKVALALGD